MFLFLLLLTGTLILVLYMCRDNKRRAQERERQERARQQAALEKEMKEAMGLPHLHTIKSAEGVYDSQVGVSSKQALETYDAVRFFREDSSRLECAIKTCARKQCEKRAITAFFEKENGFENRVGYNNLKEKFETYVSRANDGYVVRICYTTPSGRTERYRFLTITNDQIDEFVYNPTLLMTKAEANKHAKEEKQRALTRKQESFYARINAIIDLANTTKEHLLHKETRGILDGLVAGLFERTVVSIQKAKSADDKVFDVIREYIGDVERQVGDIVAENNTILAYYNSPDFSAIKSSCDALMQSQREFNDYIDEKARSIASLLGAQVLRNETVNADTYNYIRPYKKEVTPFTAEVSQAVFASAENSPLEYIVKCFYNNREVLPEQVQKLHTLVEELETLSEAKEIIARQKEEYAEYIRSVPALIMERDPDGFYARLGFANIDERVLSLEYKFSYTSNGGFAQRSFTVPMNEDNIVKLIRILEGKLTYAAFAKEQRALMTSKLRLKIKERDGYTCCCCGNSTHNEPNLLLEIDHIIPVAKGGTTVEENLQTLCWKCNRAKSDKLG